MEPDEQEFWAAVGTDRPLIRQNWKYIGKFPERKEIEVKIPARVYSMEVTVDLADGPDSTVVWAPAFE